MILSLGLVIFLFGELLWKPNRRVLCETREGALLLSGLHLRSYLARSVGLLNSVSIQEGTFVFFSSSSLHTRGMTQCIDVWALDRRFRILKHLKRVPANSWRVSLPRRTKYVIESRVGDLTDQLKEGDVVRIRSYN